MLRNETGLALNTTIWAPLRCSSVAMLSASAWLVVFGMRSASTGVMPAASSASTWAE